MKGKGNELGGNKRKIHRIGIVGCLLPHATQVEGFIQPIILLVEARIAHHELASYDS